MMQKGGGEKKNKKERLDPSEALHKKHNPALSESRPLKSKPTATATLRDAPSPPRVAHKWRSVPRQCAREADTGGSRESRSIRPKSSLLSEGFSHPRRRPLLLWLLWLIVFFFLSFSALLLKHARRRR